MEKQALWNLIEQARQDAVTSDVADIAKAFTDLLTELAPEQIEQSDEALRLLSRDANTWPLQGAAYVINAGCSDAEFDSFRGWLFAQGQVPFERAVANPDSLADIVSFADRGETFSEDMLTAAWAAYLHRTGSELPLGEIIPQDDRGERPDFDDDDYLRAQYPELSKIFLI